MNYYIPLQPYRDLHGGFGPGSGRWKYMCDFEAFKLIEEVDVHLAQTANEAWYRLEDQLSREQLTRTSMIP